MGNKSIELMLSTREWLNQSTPLITYKITYDPSPYQSAKLDARTLMFFEGISLGKLNVSEDVRTPITLKKSGKLSLRDPKPKIPDYLSHVLSTLSALVGFGTSLDPEKIYHGLSGIYNEYKGRTELVKRDWDLVFNEGYGYDELNGPIGTCTYEAKKYSPRSKHGLKVMEEFEKETGVDLSSLSEKVQIDLINTHFLDINVIVKARNK
ncbi:MAG: hypothetical protein ABIG84_02775 [archaeon]